jgi:uncharacterized membrane protein
MKKNILAAVVLVLAVCSLVGGWMWYDKNHRLPGLPKTVDEATAIIASPAFKRLPEGRKMEYIDASRKLFEQLPREERRAFMQTMRDNPQAKEAGREAMAEMMMSQAKNFAKLPDVARNLILDRLIDGHEKAVERAKTAKPLSPEEQAKREERMKAAMAEMRQYIQGQIESGNPQRQALVGEGMKAVRDRRIARGLPADPEPPRRR